ncbi:hypothetical protein GP486_008137, partial [Trichoglossum hirsutum]
MRFSALASLAGFAAVATATTYDPNYTPPSSTPTPYGKGTTTTTTPDAYGKGTTTSTPDAYGQGTTSTPDAYGQGGSSATSSPGYPDTMGCPGVTVTETVTITAGDGSYGNSKGHNKGHNKGHGHGGYNGSKSHSSKSHSGCYCTETTSDNPTELPTSPYDSPYTPTVVDTSSPAQTTPPSYDGTDNPPDSYTGVTTVSAAGYNPGYTPPSYTSSATGADPTVIVGGGTNLTFSPSYIKQVKPGQKIHFQFLARNHSVTESSFGHPCLPKPGVDSDFRPNLADKLNPTLEFLVEVKNTSARYFYCKQTMPANHCSKGMVFAINVDA